jgi:hypothetical protein
LDDVVGTIALAVSTLRASVRDDEGAGSPSTCHLATLPVAGGLDMGYGEGRGGDGGPSAALWLTLCVCNGGVEQRMYAAGMLLCLSKTYR